MHALLRESGLWEPGAARYLQDPLTFRCVPQLHGAARDALRFVEAQLAIELNAHQGNPLVVPSEGRVVSVGNFDS
jgi:histidine ammonia-lyase